MKFNLEHQIHIKLVYGYGLKISEADKCTKEIIKLVDEWIKDQ